MLTALSAALLAILPFSALPLTSMHICLENIWTPQMRPAVSGTQEALAHNIVWRGDRKHGSQAL